MLPRCQAKYAIRQAAIVVPPIAAPSATVRGLFESERQLRQRRSFPLTPSPEAPARACAFSPATSCGKSAAVFLTTLATMTAFVFVALIGKEAVENGLGLTPILRMLPYMLPQAMQFAVPGALLMAATSVYGRVSASNEVVAIKALGISPMTLIWPARRLATAISLVAVLINDVAVSWGDGGVRRVIIESLEDIAYGRLRTMRSFNTDQLKVNVEAVAGQQLIEPIIQFASSDGRPPSIIKADAAEMHADVAAQRHDDQAVQRRGRPRRLVDHRTPANSSDRSRSTNSPAAAKASARRRTMPCAKSAPRPPSRSKSIATPRSMKWPPTRGRRSRGAISTRCREAEWEQRDRAI